VVRRRFQTWLIEETAPFWRDRGVDEAAGGFHEKLDLERHPIVDEGKRIMVQARQVFTFARLADRVDGAADAARNGLNFLFDHGRHPDGGWRHRVTRDGRPLDDKRDLYDQAFVIFAAAAAMSFRKDARAIADATLEYLEAARRHPAGGYVECVEANGEPAEGPRLQNPHMHLFEALLAMHEASGEAAYLDRAAELFRLARDRFVVDGALREYFSQDLTPADGDAGRIVEPGHHFEWVWLLHRYADMAAVSEARDLAARLYAFACDHGIGAGHGGVIDRVSPTGAVLKPDRRLWAQTEALKAHAACLEATGDKVAVRRLDAQLAVLLRDHLVGEKGAWQEHLDADGINFHGFLPASSLYHVTFAASELDRILTNED